MQRVTISLSLEQRDTLSVILTKNNTFPLLKQKVDATKTEETEPVAVQTTSEEVESLLDILGEPSELDTQQKSLREVLLAAFRGLHSS